MYFPDLGLLIVEEEHRLGFNRKEKTRARYRGIDALFISATPIPRTFHLYDDFGKQSVVDLVLSGREIAVTEDNSVYVRLVTEVRMTKAIEKQIEAFKKGFYELIPYDDIRIYNELELELLMSGLPDIDMADLKANVEYTGYTAASPPITWFWRCNHNMDQEDLARLVMFVTGNSKVPLEGFETLPGMNGVQKFQIHYVSGNTVRLPLAQTCFNPMDLPEYRSAEIFFKLLHAVRECIVGFGFAFGGN
ncbi:unnamed protein product [Chondrus crispus]|uniref:HECT-type E3 ubiquitin transferase n=1 Tax=Chondrus crispus TaxID=2769 RepID=R7QQM3_CHOCR|nr:unnamed protein product [Chondrus crispus]CDF40023.1 unnamed protein product [Chondrus crispus]|eukprot:XP_005710317.1 unnamed protein product [Chondrus crispus]